VQQKEETGAGEMNIPGLGEVVERLRRATVVVRPGGRRGNGSGVLWGSDGVVVTNAHVAQGSTAEITLWDGQEFRAELMHRDLRRDLAALRIAAKDLSFLEARDTSLVRPGEMAIAVGNPLGFVGALTTGVIHAVGPLPGLGKLQWVQADVRLAPGNSGGPLTDVQGRILGINTMVAGRLALAIPSNDITRFLMGDSESNWLGVTISPVRLPRNSSPGIGLVLLEIEPNSPAAQASLLPGDILIGTEAGTFRSVEDLAAALDGGGSRVLRLEFLRGDYSRVRKVSVQLANRGKDAIAA
jgi:serine protease Do